MDVQKSGVTGGAPIAGSAGGAPIAGSAGGAPIAGSAGGDIARWRSAVAGVLVKGTRRDPADLPAEPERLLDSPTYEGFPIRPLYTRIDALPEPSLPGQWPYVRGGDALRDV